MSEPSDPSSPEASADQAGEAASRSDRLTRRETAARNALRALIRDHYLQQFGAVPPPNPEVHLDLRLTARPAEGWDVRFDPPLAEQINGPLEDAQARVQVFRPGRVYCFRCRSSGCEHAGPPEPHSVFRGYSSTGTAEWHEFIQALVEARDPRADRLFAAPPEILAVVRLGRDLRQEQLSTFGRASKSYSILGQAVFGYLRIPPKLARHGDPAGGLAVTVQAVETRDPNGVARIRLNLLAHGVDPARWAELRAEERLAPLDRALAEATAAVERMEGRVQAAKASGSPAQIHEEMRAIPRILLRLARAVEQGGRRAVRRSRHAERHSRQERPVHKAAEDAQAAGPEDLFVDEKRGTWVACGRQGRAHVFSRDGKHVTSFTLPPGGADFRLRTQRWRRMTPEERAEFHARVHAT